MRKQFVKTLSDCIKNDPKLFLVLGDISVFGFRHIFQDYPNQIKNIGILEQATISYMAGLAMGGYTPVFHSIAPFTVERCLEQIKLDIGYQNLKASIVSIGASYDYSALGPSHHAPGDVQCLLTIPDFPIMVPGHPEEFDHLFKTRYNKDKGYYRLSEQKNNDPYVSDYGQAVYIKKVNNAKLTIITVGPSLQPVLDATETINDCNILYYTTIWPFDYNALSNVATRKILIFSPFYAGTILPLVNIAIRSIFDTSIFDYSQEKQFITQCGTINNYDKSPGEIQKIIESHLC